MAINKIEADYDKGCKLYNVVKSETINPLRLIEENKTKDPSHPGTHNDDVNLRRIDDDNLRYIVLLLVLYHINQVSNSTTQV